MNSSKSTAVGTLLLSLSVVLGGLSQDGALGKNNNGLATQLLLELTDDAILNLVELGKKAERNENKDCFVSIAKIDLLNRSANEGKQNNETGMERQRKQTLAEVM